MEGKLRQDSKGTTGNSQHHNLDFQIQAICNSNKQHPWLVDMVMQQQACEYGSHSANNLTPEGTASLAQLSLTH